MLDFIDTILNLIFDSLLGKIMRHQFKDEVNCLNMQMVEFL